MSDPRLQSSLDDYSVSVQRYKLQAVLLPPSFRPPILERFQHRNNRWAVDRQTVKVRKVISRMEDQLRRAQPDVAAGLATAVGAGNPRDNPPQDLEASGPVAELPDNSGCCCGEEGTPTPVRLGFPTDVKDSVVMAQQDTCDRHTICPHSTDGDKVSIGTGCDPVSFSVADELDSFVRVGVVSPNAAMQLSGLIDTLRSDGASCSVLKKVCTAFLGSVQAGIAIERDPSCIPHNYDGVDE
ncbi:hypothetical protein FN846DRAFT_891628 [Sphaerosporella brunnea]|uniref:Uncharacterized protein n=1 Tax=Sphaerosporella brunnea TaxID=1250544 RepID=A0A5J5ETV5_9PEZI|nr:hypothetical protein FN846DRAFT_891628 [Sphaerosporella brunnea]